ncbi:peptidylprolyl isomerase [Paenibacillus alkalitolerans]|uniref:peptidylprolyl isomerase n=1 Tax=Paenibacillus alkalitolerans TaxID=2799335 RepID=UPI0018F3D172|nr:peptidylprolyl isomerase [Paenibacillus alkalitolerans]
MSREKLLWGASGALIAAVVTTALLLAWPLQPLPDDRDERAPDPSANRDESAQKHPPNSSSDSVARVGDVSLSRDQFLRDIERMYGDQYIKEWMERSAVRLEAQELGIGVKREEIERELERMQSGYDSKEQFYRTMKEQLGLTEEELRADALYRLQLEKIATNGIVVTDADVERYISEHPEEFGPKREIRFAQIVVETKEDAEEVLAELGEGTEFELLARDRSIDEDTASAGGDIGWIGVTDPFVPPEMMEAARRLPVGGVSAPIRLEDGRFAVITLLGKRDIRPADDSEVRESLRWELILSKAPPLDEVLEQLLRKWGARSMM